MRTEVLRITQIYNNLESSMTYLQEIKELTLMCKREKFKFIKESLGTGKEPLGTGFYINLSNRTIVISENAQHINSIDDIIVRISKEIDKLAPELLLSKLMSRLTEREKALIHKYEE